MKDRVPAVQAAKKAPRQGWAALFGAGARAENLECPSCRSSCFGTHAVREAPASSTCAWNSGSRQPHRSAVSTRLSLMDRSGRPSPRVAKQELRRQVRAQAGAWVRGELVSVEHGKEADDEGNTGHGCPRRARKHYHLASDNEEGDQPAEDKAATKAKPLLEQIWFRRFVHWCGCTWRGPCRGRCRQMVAMRRNSGQPETVRWTARGKSRKDGGR